MANSMMRIQNEYYPQSILHQVYMLVLSYLCAPALLFVAFSLTQVLIDIYRAAYETALVKFTVMIVFTFLLNVLCQQGLSLISWMIVFIPFIMMTLITALILVMLGLSPDVDVRKPARGMRAKKAAERRWYKTHKLKPPKRGGGRDRHRSRRHRKGGRWWSDKKDRSWSPDRRDRQWSPDRRDRHWSPDRRDGLRSHHRDRSWSHDPRDRSWSPDPRDRSWSRGGKHRSRREKPQASSRRPGRP